MSELSYAGMIERCYFSEKHVVQIYAYETWKNLMNSNADDFSEAKLIMTSAGNVRKDGFLYPILSKYNVHSVTFGESCLIVIQMLGNPEELKKDIMKAAREREAFVFSHNRERYNGELKADFVF